MGYKGCDGSVIAVTEDASGAVLLSDRISTNI